MSGIDEGYYICHICGGTKFSHDVTEIFEEVFDSKEKTVKEGKHYNEGEVWCCMKCNNGIPKYNISEFMEQMYDASS